MIGKNYEEVFARWERTNVFPGFREDIEIGIARVAAFFF
jgi:hypothetical protein